MTTTTTTVVDAYLVTLDEIGDAWLAVLLRRQLSPDSDERFCFVVIERDHEVYTLAIDGAWALLALEVQRSQPDTDFDMDLPRQVLRAVLRGRVDATARGDGGSPSIALSGDGIPHVSRATTG